MKQVREGKEDPSGKPPAEKSKGETGGSSRPSLPTEPNRDQHETRSKSEEERGPTDTQPAPQRDRGDGFAYTKSVSDSPPLGKAECSRMLRSLLHTQSRTR